MSEPEPLPVTCDKPGPLIQFRSARGFEWNRISLPIADLPPELDGLRIFHFSDLHTRNYWDPAFDDLIAGLKRNPPDIILFTGDFVDCKRDHRPALAHVGRLMNSLSSRLGTFAILGNHDGDLLGANMAAWNVTLITHRRLRLQSGNAVLELIGLPGVERHDLDMPWVRSLGPKENGALRVALCHFPDLLLRVGELEADLFLCGHTHGGQVAIPGRRWPLIRHDSLPRRLCSGIHRVGKTVLVANRGMGFSSPVKVRFNCPAEVIEIIVRQNARRDFSPPAMEYHR